MKTDETSKKIIILIICIALLFLVAFISCNGNSSANANIPEDTEYMRELRWYDETLRAYNHLLHRVWIDRPNYVEDVLTECDEFIELDSLLNGHWGDTFEFYNRYDSVCYHNNWMNENNLPPHVEKKLRSVFGE